MRPQQILPVKKAPSRSVGEAYVRIGLKAFYISNEAMKQFGDTDYIRISMDKDNRVVIVSKATEKGDDTFKLSHVCESGCARRIETNRSLLSMIRGGFPLYMIDRHLPTNLSLDGSLLADFSLPIPLKEG